MLLSIGIITYERPGYLDELLKTIYQSEVLNDKDVELVILNNGSGKETIDLLQNWNRKIDFTLLQNEQNSRGKEGYKRLFEALRGEWIITPGDDDRFRPGGLRNILNECRSAEKTVTLIPFGAKTIDENGNSTPIVFKPQSFSSRNDFLANTFFESPFWMPATVLRRNTVELSKIPRSITVVDWWLWLNGGIKGEIRAVPYPVIEYRIHTGQEQKSYLEDSWQLDRASAFISDIQNGVIYEYISKSSIMECNELNDCLVSKLRIRTTSIIEKILLVQYCRVVELFHPTLAPKLKHLLIFAGIDLRFSAAITNTNLSTTDYLNAIKHLMGESVVPGTKLTTEHYSKNSINELEKELSTILSSYRSQELRGFITPFEKKLLHIFRTLRFNPIIRRIIRK